MLNKASKAALSDVLLVLLESRATIRCINYNDKVNEMRIRKTDDKLEDAIRQCNALIGKEENIA